MALSLSTGLRQFLTGEGSLRKAFEDGILNIYSGAAPANADAAPTGVLLAKITVGSGAVTANARSTPQLKTVTISGTYSGVAKFLLNGVAIQYSLVAGDSTAALAAVSIARFLNDTQVLSAIETGTTCVIYVQYRFDGGAFTLTENSSTTVSVSVYADIAANVALITCKLGVAVLGAISKDASTWSGVALADGTAGYFRLVTTLDGADSDTDYSDCRIQCNVSTSGAELNLSNINLVSGATETIDTFTLTEPASA